MPDDVEEQQVVASDMHCRHCGAAKNVARHFSPVTGQEQVYEAGEDWLCAECQRWQDQMACPTCGSIVRISLMPSDLAPKAVKPKK